MWAVPTPSSSSREPMTAACAVSSFTWRAVQTVSGASRRCEMHGWDKEELEELLSCNSMRWLLFVAMAFTVPVFYFMFVVGGWVSYAGLVLACLPDIFF